MQMKRKNYIVLFEKDSCGTVIHAPLTPPDCQSYSLGYYADNWAMEGFEEMPEGTQVVISI